MVCCGVVVLMWWGVVCCVCLGVRVCVTVCLVQIVCCILPLCPFPTVSLQFGLKTSDVLLFDRVFSVGRECCRVADCSCAADCWVFNIDPSCVSYGNEPISSAGICLWIHHGLTLVNIPVAMNSAGVVTDKDETNRVFRQSGKLMKCEIL